MIQNLDNTAFLKYATQELKKHFDLHENVRVAKRLANEHYSLIEDIEKRLKSIDCFFCNRCRKWKKRKYMLEVSSPLVNGECKVCAKDRYYTVLAKASISNAGLSLYDAPKELIELEKLRVKTRHHLKNQK